MLSDPEQEVTTIQASRWMKTVIQQRWLLTSEAWEERNMVLHKGTNTSITKSDYDEKIKRLYKQQHTINKRDSHLFSKTLQELLTAQLGTKPRFLEKAAFLFKESARLAKQGQQNLHQFYSTTPRHLEDKQPRPTVWPQTPLRSQTQLTTFFTHWNEVKEWHLRNLHSTKWNSLTLIRESVSTSFSPQTGTERHQTWWDDPWLVSFTHKNPGLACQEALCWIPYQS